MENTSPYFIKKLNVYGRAKNQPYTKLCDWTSKKDLTKEIKFAVSDLIGSKNIESVQKGGGNANTERYYSLKIVNHAYHDELLGHRTKQREVEMSFDDDE